MVRLFLAPENRKSKLVIHALQFQIVIINYILTQKSLICRRADRNKQTGLEKSATLPTYLLSKLINEQGGIFHLLHEKLQFG